MDVGKWKESLKLSIGKYKYAMLVLVIGLALMCIPGKDKSNVDIEPVTQPTEPLQEDLGQELSQLLSTIEGAGKVRVMVSEAQGAQTLYQTDTITSQDNSGTDIRTETILITDSSRNQTGLIQQMNPPTYQGAIILAQGADSPTVKLALTEAVSKITGLGADKISVLKMK